MPDHPWTKGPVNQTLGGPIAILGAFAEELSPIEKALTGRRLVHAEGGTYLAEIGRAHV